MVPMPIGAPLFQAKEMDFVVELPKSEGYNTNLVCTDLFPKVQQ